MSDLTEKLRHLSPFKGTQDIATEAAERIEALEQELAIARGRAVSTKKPRPEASSGEKDG